MNNLKNGMLLALLFLSGAPAIAQETTVWSGWMDFGSCNRVKYYTDDFGIEWPTNESVGQTVTGEIYLVGTVQDWVVDTVKSCAVTGVAAAGASALLTQGAAVWPTFGTAFNSCLAATSVTDVVADNLGFRTVSHCNW